MILKCLPTFVGSNFSIIMRRAHRKRFIPLNKSSQGASMRKQREAYGRMNNKWFQTSLPTGKAGRKAIQLSSTLHHRSL